MHNSNLINVKVKNAINKENEQRENQIMQFAVNFFK